MVITGLNSVLPVLIVLVMPHVEKNMVPATTELSDKEAIIQHIHGLFRAFIRGDRDAVRHGHTDDWRGFQIKSDHIVRGIDDYMTVADTLIGKLPVTRYELLDTELQIYGDMAVVYYVSREWLRTADGGEKTFDLRSVDIYRREAHGWNQCGSNICFVPGKGIEPAGRDAETKLTPDEEKELLAMREQLWYALFGNDVEAIRTMVPDEVIAIDAGVDAWADGPEVLRRCARFAKSGGKLVRLEFPDTRMQRYGDTVIMYTAYIYEIERESKRSETRGRVTEVFIKRDGRWLNTGWHMDSGS